MPSHDALLTPPAPAAVRARGRRAAALLAVLLPVLPACGDRIFQAPEPRVAVPIPGEDPTVMRARTQSPVDATTIPGVTGR